MKPEYPANGDNSAVSNAMSSEKQERNSINDSKNKDDELDEFSSEFLNKINSFFEIHNSFLYEDVHENASSLEKYLSTDSSSEVIDQINGNYCEEDEIIDDEKSYSVDSQKIYSSLKRYCLRNVKETSDLLSENGNIDVQSTKNSLKNQYSVEIEKKISIPDSFQLPTSNETQNAVTLGAYAFENSMLDIKFPVHNLSGLSQDLTEAQRSVRLNKKSTVKKSFKKLSKEKFITPCKTKQGFIPKELSFTDVIKKCELENVTSVHGSLEINSSLNVVYGIAENEMQEKQVHVILTDFLDNSQDFKRQLKDKSDILCLEKALSELRNKFQNEAKSESKIIQEKNCEKPSERTLNKSNTRKSSKKDKAASAVVKKKVNKTNDSEKVKDKNFIPDLQNQQNSSESSTNLLKEKLSKKNNLRVSNRLAKNSVSELSSKNKSVSRKKSIPQNNKVMKIKFVKKNTSKKTAALNNKDIFSENNFIKNTALYADEIGSDLIKDKVLATNENRKQKSKSMRLLKTKTSTSVSQNSPVKSLNNCLNKSASSSGLSGMSQKNSNSFLQLFNKVVESTNSEKVAESNNFIAKLFEQRNSLKLQSPNRPSKETDEKLLEEKLHQSNSIKENGRKNLPDLKSFKTVEEKMTKNAPFEKKQTLQANAEVIFPLKKKCNKKEPFKKNVDKSQIKDKNFCKDDFNEYNNDKTTKVAKQQSFNDTVINQLSHKQNKNQKLKDGHNGITNSLQDVSTDLCIQEKNKIEKKLAEHFAVNSSKVANLLAESCPAAVSVIESVSNRRPRKRKLSTVDSQSSLRSRRKAGSIIKSNSLMPASFLKIQKL